MKNNVFFWYYILNKRLFKKVSFLIILLLIPLLIFFVSSAAQEGSSFIRIAMSAEDTSDSTSIKILEKLNQESDLIDYTVCKNKEEAFDMVRYGEADTAWIVVESVDKKIQRVVEGDKVPLVKIYDASTNFLTRAVREKIISAIYPQLSYSLYKYHVLQVPVSEPLTEDELKEGYSLFYGSDSFVKISYLNSDKTFSLEETNYVTSTLRGLLSIVMLLSGFAAVLYFKNDEKLKVFYLLSVPKRYLVFTGNTLAALSISGLFVSVSLMLSGTYTTFLNESLWMIIFIFAACGFCNLLGAICSTEGKASLLLPVIIVVSISFCPILFNTKNSFQVIMPLYYYLYGIGNMSHIISALVYIIVTFVLSYFIYVLRGKKA